MRSDRGANRDALTLDADVRWPLQYYSTQDHPPPRSPPAARRVFAVKGKRENWTTTHRIFEWARRTPNMILATAAMRPPDPSRVRAEKGDTKFLDGATNEEEEYVPHQEGSRTSPRYGCGKTSAA